MAEKVSMPFSTPALWTWSFTSIARLIAKRARASRRNPLVRITTVFPLMGSV